MDAGGFVAHGRKRHYKGYVNTFVVITCIVSAMGGLLYRYDVGISRGLTKFFPLVLEKQKNDAGPENEYCEFDSQLLTLYLV
ncbi:hypothetical protein REPUB_Repub04eG0116900 [Reevesia pubescens]